MSLANKTGNQSRLSREKDWKIPNFRDVFLYLVNWRIKNTAHVIWTSFLFRPRFICRKSNNGEWFRHFSSPSPSFIIVLTEFRHTTRVLAELEIRSKVPVALNFFFQLIPWQSLHMLLAVNARFMILRLDIVDDSAKVSIATALCKSWIGIDLMSDTVCECAHLSLFGL